MHRLWLRALFEAYRDDPELHPHTRDIIEASAMLGVSEFDFLRIAHREWFGQAATSEQINRLFANHMLGGAPPFWAHRLAEEIIHLYEHGELRRSRFGVEPPPSASLQDILIGFVQMAVLLGLAYILFDFIASYPGYPGL